MNELKLMLPSILSGELFRNFCLALIILVAGVLAIRIIGKILAKALEKSKLEKAAHVLIVSLAKTALYILLGGLVSCLILSVWGLAVVIAGIGVLVFVFIREYVYLYQTAKNAQPFAV